MSKEFSRQSDQPAGRAPTTGAAGVVRWEDLGGRIRAKRKADGLTLEQAARQSGVSAATLSRWERQWERQQMGTTIDDVAEGGPGPDTRTLAAITRWLGVPLESVVAVERPPQEGCVLHGKGDDTPGMIEAHLRADRNLDPETAAALARMFRVAYEQLSRLRPSALHPVGGETVGPANSQLVESSAPTTTSGAGENQERMSVDEQDAAD